MEQKNAKFISKPVNEIYEYFLWNLDKRIAKDIAWLVEYDTVRSVKVFGIVESRIELEYILVVAFLCRMP